MSYRGDLWSPVYDYCKLLFNGIVSISRIICSNKIRVERGGQYAPLVFIFIIYNIITIIGNDL